jgi:cardiolipin synthase
VELSQEAEHVLFVSQYCPTGKLARVLKKTDADLYFNRPAQATFLSRILNKWSIFITNLHSSYVRKQYLHAKFIIFTMKDGSKVALTGSHNFAYTGVLLGTREVALETKDPAVVSQLEAFFKEHVV